jgi:hypothetical protein
MSKDTAKATLTGFLSRPSAVLWPKVDKAALVAGLSARVDNPDLIRQGATPYCGPASLTRTIAADNPDGYVQAAIDLYAKGTAQIGTLQINASSGVRESNILGNTNAADWLMLASIRDSNNWFFSPAGWFGLNVAGITLPGELCKWFRNAGYTEIVSSTYLATMTKPIPSVVALEIYRANQLALAGYRVALFINADILDSDDQDGFSFIPDHWVVLSGPIRDGGITAYDSSISLSVFTWGRIQNIPVSPAKALKKRAFMDHYYGFVATRL